MRGLGGRARVGLHHRRDRADRRVRRAVHPPVHAAARRCSAPWPASRSRSSRCGRPRRCGRRCGSPCRCIGDHPGRLLHRREAAGQHPGRAGRAAASAPRSAGSAATCRAPDVSDRGPGHRRRRCRRSNFDLLGQRARRHRPAAGHRDPAGHLQLHRGHDQRGERRGGGRQLQPAQRPARRRHRRRRRLGARLARSRPPSTSGTRAGRPPAGASATRWRPASSSRCCASSGCSGCSARCCRCPRSCRSCSSSAC